MPRMPRRIKWITPKEIKLRTLKSLLNEGEEFAGSWDQVTSQLKKSPSRYEGFKIHFPLDTIYSTRGEMMTIGGVFDPVNQKVSLFGGDPDIARQAGLVLRARSRRYSPKTIRAIAKLIDDKFSPRTVTFNPSVSEPRIPVLAESFGIRPFRVHSEKGTRASSRLMDKRKVYDWDDLDLAREKVETFDFRSPRIRKWLAKGVKPYKLIVED